MNPDTFKGICDDISSSGDKQSFMKKVIGSVKANMEDSTHFVLTIEDPPEYSIEDASVLSWTGNISGKTVGVKLYSPSSLDKIPPWSIPAAENATDPGEGNIQKAWNSGHPGGATIEDPPEAAPSNPDGNPETVAQEGLRGGQLKWNEQRGSEAASSSPDSNPSRTGEDFGQTKGG